MDSADSHETQFLTLQFSFTSSSSSSGSAHALYLAKQFLSWKLKEIRINKRKVFIFINYYKTLNNLFK